MDNKGFSLIELMVATTLMAMMLIGIAGIFPLGTQDMMVARSITHATDLAQQRMERITPKDGWQSQHGANVTTVEDGQYTVNHTVNTINGGSEMRLVVVTVTWTIGSRQRNVRLQTYIL